MQKCMISNLKKIYALIISCLWLTEYSLLNPAFLSFDFSSIACFIWSMKISGTCSSFSYTSPTAFTLLVCWMPNLWDDDFGSSSGKQENSWFKDGAIS